MELDLTTVVSGAIGSLIAMAGSIIVAFLYIRNQNKLENIKRINEQIQKTYVEEGILPIQEAITEYALSSIFTILDYRKYMNTTLKRMNNEDLFLEKIDDLKNRPTIKIMLERQFDSAVDAFPYIRRFGSIVYGSVIRTLQNWSDLVTDILIWSNMKQQIIQAGYEEIDRSLGSVGAFIQESQMYLLRRFDNLKDYIYE